MVADLYQSAGTVPVDVTAWDVDFATGGSVKWLCGGPGAGYLYVAPRLQDRLQPRVTGWMAHEHPFAFEPGAIDYAADATRFLHGTPAVPALYAARAGYEIVTAIGVDAIRAQVGAAGAAPASTAPARTASPRARPTSRDRRGGMVILDVPHGEAVTRELLRREIIVDYRPGAGIRYLPALLHDRRRDPPRPRRDPRDPGLRRLSGARARRAEQASEPHSPWCDSHSRGSATAGRRSRLTTPKSLS